MFNVATKDCQHRYQIARYDNRLVTARAPHQALVLPNAPIGLRNVRVSPRDLVLQAHCAAPLVASCRVTLQRATKSLVPGALQLTR
jgi:hypothetical protein